MRTFPWQALQRRLAQDCRPGATLYAAARARSQTEWLLRPATASWYDRTRRPGGAGTSPAVRRLGGGQ
jgi:hypothetical protein